MLTSEEGIRLIMRFEGLSLKPYLDAVNVPTIGYGSTGPHITMSMAPISRIRAEDMLREHIRQREHQLAALLEVTLEQHQWDAIMSFVYNLGLGAFQRSTLRMKINRHEFDSAVVEFGKWVRAGGRVLPGLVKRREAEARMFAGLSS